MSQMSQGDILPALTNEMSQMSQGDLASTDKRNVANVTRRYLAGTDKRNVANVTRRYLESIQPDAALKKRAVHQRIMQVSTSSVENY
ncbi:hypothetical protein Bpfe_004830 [Biomphalaria pfeifferi]|uniref:Uncharacterized protein n=1 Tax=Biomphalaria pfeifferi TaxID=112525 RepID=A0AAD8FJB6_BIOPF|nr:hypothetical protein Bpfe_004830 [Biomphalaria pfeifferi]